MRTTEMYVEPMLIKIGNAYMDPMEILFIGDEYADVDGTHYIKVKFRGTGVSAMIEATMDEAEAALIDAGVIETPYPEQEEVPTLSVPEMQELTALFDAGYEWLARDNGKDHVLFAHAQKPSKEEAGDMWQAPGPVVKVNAPFDFIKPADAEPWSIPYLLLDARSQA